MERTFNRLDYTYKLMVVSALCIVAAILAHDIIVPLLISAFLSIILLPLVNRLEKKMSLTIAVTLVLIVTFVLFAGTLWLIGSQLASLVKDLPDLESRFLSFIQNISSGLDQQFGFGIQEQTDFLKNGLSSASQYLTNVLVSTTSTLALLVQIPIYIFLFLIYKDKFSDFFQAVLPKNQAADWKKDIAGVMQGYTSGLLLVTLIIAALNTVGLLALGIKHAIFFGVLSGILTIIPYIGIFIGALLPTLMALLTKDSIWYAIGVVIIFSVVQFLEGNFITPRITGSKVRINALAAILALLIGGKILGITGMILAIPIVGIVKGLLQYSQHMKPFVILLEDDSVNASPKKQSKKSEKTS
jgi:predicted PurR-regulated permease PerM